MKRLVLRLLFVYFLPLTILLMPASVAYLKSLHPSALATFQSTTQIKFVQENPVVNEGNQITVMVSDMNGQALSGVTFESGSPEIASVDPSTGVVMGVAQGFATVTARMGGNSVSTFVTVARVSSSQGAQVTGETVVDSEGAIYLSDPTTNVIFRKNSPTADTEVFAGQSGKAGMVNGARSASLFSGPIGVGVDNRAQGGVFIADALNHSVRKIDFNDQVSTLVGSGSPGVNSNDVTTFDQAAFRGPRGIAVDSNGLIYIADTENHAIYSLNTSTREVKLLAGQPGVSGRSNGKGRSATFSRPSAISIKKSTGGFGTGGVGGLLIADTGNNRIRFVTFDGQTSTVGNLNTTASTPSRIRANNDSGDDDDDFDDGGGSDSNDDGDGADDDGDGIDNVDDDGNFVFDDPDSIETDENGNVYIADDTGVKIITQVGDKNRLISLAQPRVSFSQVAGIEVKGTQVFVIDSGESQNRRFKVVTVGAPEILGLSQTSDRLEGGATVTITGRNFSPESMVFLGDSEVTRIRIESATKIQIKVPAQKAPGKRTLSVQTRGGVAQIPFTIVSKPLSEISEGEITTIAGGVPFIGDGGKALGAILNRPTSIAIDGTGQLFIADGFNRRIRRVDSNENSRLITTVVGDGTPEFGGDDGPAIGAGIDFVTSIAFDSVGNLFIADQPSARVRRVDAQTGIITTFAGNGIQASTGDNGLATEASIVPEGIALDSAGNLFISESESNRIRRVDVSTGIIRTIAGDGTAGFAGDGGAASSAKFNRPTNLAFDSDDNLIVVDTGNHRIRQISKALTITTIVGNGRADFSGDGGLATMASLRDPSAVAFDSFGNLLIADTGNARLRRVSMSTKTITTIAGNGMRGFNGENTRALDTAISPVSLAVTGMGRILFADDVNNRIRGIDVRADRVMTVVGTDGAEIVGDGAPAVDARLELPSGMAFDQAGNLFVADTGNNRIRRVDIQTGRIETLAGNGRPGMDEPGSARNTSVTAPLDVTADGSGNFYITNMMGRRVRRVTGQNGMVTNFAGSDRLGFGGDGAQAINATFNGAERLAIDSDGNVYIADNRNFRVRRVDIRTGIITTFAGNGMPGFSGDGGSADRASFTGPLNLAFDRSGNLLIADSGNNRVRVVDSRTRTVRTIAGNGSEMSKGDGGQATQAAVERPTAVFADEAGNIFIAEFTRVRRVAPNGIITTVAGGGTVGYSGDNGPATSANMFGPSEIALDRSGNLFIADTFNNAIRVIKAVNRPSATTDFRLNIDPAIQTLQAGSSTNFRIAAQTVGSFNQPINLSARVVSQTDRISVNFSQPSFNPSGSATMTVRADASLRPSVVTIIVTGTAGNIVRTQAVTLSIVAGNSVDFSLAVNPPSQTIRSGSSAEFTVGVSSSGGTRQSATLAAVVTPNNLRTSFSQTTIAFGESTKLMVEVPPNTSSSSFTIRVLATVGQTVRSQTVALAIIGNSAPVFSAIDDQTVGVGTVSTLPVSATDPDGNTGLRLSVVSAPAYVSLTDNGNGSGSLQIAPTPAQMQSGRVTLQATDPAGLTAQVAFNVTVQQPSVVITNATFSRPILTITGSGFGSSGVRVGVNGSDVTSLVQNQTNTSITVRGNRNRLGIKKGQNRVVVSAGGVVSNTFTFNF